MKCLSQALLTFDEVRHKLKKPILVKLRAFPEPRLFHSSSMIISGQWANISISVQAGGGTAGFSKYSEIQFFIHCLKQTSK